MKAKILKERNKTEDQKKGDLKLIFTSFHFSSTHTVKIRSPVPAIYHGVAREIRARYAKVTLRLNRRGYVSFRNLRITTVLSLGPMLCLRTYEEEDVLVLVYLVTGHPITKIGSKIFIWYGQCCFRWVR